MMSDGLIMEAVSGDDKNIDLISLQNLISESIEFKKYSPL